MKTNRLVQIFVALLLAAQTAAEPQSEPTSEPRSITTLEELRAARSELAHRPRRLIANNDGCDCLYFPRDVEPTVENFLARRTTNLKGSQVDTISYCSISSGFSHFTHNTKEGVVLTRHGSEYGYHPEMRNIAVDLIEQGTDTLQAVTEFSHENGMEAFWSFRMNDTHDVAHTSEKPYFLFPKLKEEHPDWLVGDHRKRTPYGRWSSVNYGLPEIRDLAFKYVQEVCRNYDVDGVELDFFRHLTYFKSTANGGVASPQECAAMTELLRRIRQMTEEVGLNRDRPILISIRVPDSPAYGRDMGLDFEQWMREGLIDLLVTTGYFRLNTWEESVRLGHQYGVPVYPGLTDSRVQGESRFKRASVEGYRGRAATAWSAGADGLYFFNLYDIDRESPLWQELGDVQALRFTRKLYFLTDVDGDPNSWLAAGKQYQRLPVVTPARPATLLNGKPFSTAIHLGEDAIAARKAGYELTSRLHLDVPEIHDTTRVEVHFNGTRLANEASDEGWIDCMIPPESIRPGANQIEIKLNPLATLADDEWSVVYDGKSLPRIPWRRDRGSERTHEEIIDGSLLLADRGEQNGDDLFYRNSWGADPNQVSVAEARVKVVKGSSLLIVANGRSGERLRLSPGQISLFHQSNIVWKMNTTDDFHRYRMIINGDDLEVYVDGELRIDAPGALKPRSAYPRNEFSFGASNSPETGEALWNEVRIRAAKNGVPLRDVVVSVDYRKK